MHLCQTHSIHSRSQSIVIHHQAKKCSFSKLGMIAIVVLVCLHPSMARQVWKHRIHLFVCSLCLYRASATFQTRATRAWGPCLRGEFAVAVSEASLNIYRSPVSVFAVPNRSILLALHSPFPNGPISLEVFRVIIPPLLSLFDIASQLLAITATLEARGAPRVAFLGLTFISTNQCNRLECVHSSPFMHGSGATLLAHKSG